MSVHMNGKKLLLVEDEDALRFLYNRQLKLAGYEVDTAPDGASAMKFMEDNVYDLVLLDLMLPDTNGIDMLKTLNEKSAVLKSPVFLLTNLAEEAIIQQGYKLGISGYILKAEYTPDQIIEQIDTFVNKPKATS